MLAKQYKKTNKTFPVLQKNKLIAILSHMYVYLIKSKIKPTKQYIGLTGNLKQRIKAHNSGKSPHTSKFRPWKLQVAIWFDNDDKARKFEYYLKHGSGHAFAKRHFWN